MISKKLKVIGSSNHTNEERSLLDYYGTNPRSVEALLNVETFNENIWECASGHNLITNVLKEKGFNVYSTDICDYGCQDEVFDFLSFTKEWDGDIVTNPPYNKANEFVLKALSSIHEGQKVAFFLKTLFLEGQERYNSIYRHFPPKNVYVFIDRQVSDKNDNFNKSSAVSYAWFVWVKGFKGNPSIFWINSKERNNI